MNKKRATVRQKEAPTGAAVIDFVERRSGLIKKKLEKLALESLAATANNDEQRSFLVRTEGAISVKYCPWFVTEDWEFDGDTANLDLPWGRRRKELIKRGADPNEKELRQWRRAKCHQLATDVDWCWIAWVVPMRLDDRITGYALFLSPSSTCSDDRPVLAGIFFGVDEAREFLMAEGAVAI